MWKEIGGKGTIGVRILRILRMLRILRTTYAHTVYEYMIYSSE